VFIYRAWPGWGIFPNTHQRVAVKLLFDIYLFVDCYFAVAFADFLITLLTMQLTKRCQFNGQIYTMDFPNMTEEQYATALMKSDLGALIQEAFFFLTADEREFIMTGTPPHVWEEMFAEQES